VNEGGQAVVGTLAVSRTSGSDKIQFRSPPRTCSAFGWLCEPDLSALLVEEEGSTFCGLLEVFVAHGLPRASYTDRGSHYFYTNKACEAVDKDEHPGRPCARSARRRAHPGLLAGGARPQRADVLV
jgi:hypothetical protein